MTESNILKDFRRALRVYYRYFINSVKIHFYYNDVFFVLLGALARDSVAVVGIYFITQKFFDIGGWEMDELLFLYSLLYISYGLSMLFAAGVRTVENDISSGNFDRYLVTPLGLFFQAIVAKVDILTTVSYCFLGVVLFSYSSDTLGIFWDTQKYIVLALSLIGGGLIQSSLLLLGSILSFWTVKSGNVKYILFFNIRAFSIYPINIYPKGIMYFLTFILPFGFVNYFPAKFLLEKDDSLTLGSMYSYGSIIVGLIVFLIVFFLWSVGIRNYKSSGN
jgi:ABC-2 type transport system permease protein